MLQLLAMYVARCMCVVVGPSMVFFVVVIMPLGLVPVMVRPSGSCWPARCDWLQQLFFGLGCWVVRASAISWPV